MSDRIQELEDERQAIINTMADLDKKIGDIEAQLRESAVGYYTSGVRDDPKWRLNAQLALKSTKRRRMVIQNRLGPINRELKGLRRELPRGGDWLKLPPEQSTAVFAALRAAAAYMGKRSRESEVALLDALDLLDGTLPGWQEDGR